MKNNKLGLILLFLLPFSFISALDREKIKDEFMNGSSCGWAVTTPATATASGNANGELEVKLGNLYNWTSLSKWIYLDFTLHRYFSLKINKYPEDGSLVFKVITYQPTKEVVMYLTDAVKTIDTDGKDIYTWDILPLLEAKTMTPVQKFELQMKCLNCKLAKSFAIDWIRSEISDNALPSIEPDLTSDITAGQKKFQHFIIYGQSLSDGTQSYPSLSTENIAGNYMIGKQAWINKCNYNLNQLSPLRSSMDFYDVFSNYFTVNTGTSQNCETPIVGTVNHLQRKLTSKVAMIATSCGTGGKTIEQLAVGSSYYNDYLTTLHSMDTIMKYHNISVSCPALFWMQGEYNYWTRAGATNDKTAYKSLMINLKNNMQNDAKLAYNQDTLPIFVTYQVGCQYINNFEQTISMAQLEAANENKDIICAGAVYSMPDRNGHLDPNGYRWYGEMLAKAYYKTAILKQPFKPLQPKRFVKESSNTIRIDFLVPEPPLVFDLTIMPTKPNMGFEVRDNSILKTISSVTIDGSSVRIVCSTPFTGDVEVAYAGMANKGEGNLRDSDPYPSFDTYINLNKKDVNNQYVYPREPATASLSPQFEISSLFDKNYPMYNFCVHFYYKLPATITEYEVPNLDGNATSLLSPHVNQNIYRVESVDKNNIRIVSRIGQHWKNLNIYNTIGSSMLESTYSDSINVSSLQTGCYLLVISDNKQTMTVKYQKS